MKYTIRWLLLVIPLWVIAGFAIYDRLNPACYAEDGTQVNCDYWSK